MTENTRVNVAIPNASYEILRRIAFEQRVTVPEVIRQAVEAYLKKQK